jgi:hypothetical protein
MSGDEPLMEKAMAGQIFRGKQSVAVLDHLDFAPILIQVNGGDGVELIAQIAQRF